MLISDYVQYENNFTKLIIAKHRELVKSVVSVYGASSIVNIEKIAEEISEHYIKIKYSQIPLVEEENQRWENAYILFSMKCFNNLVAHKHKGR